MAYVNVAEWSPDQVTDWLKGLDSAIWNYIPYFLNNEIVGKTLLQIRPDELQKLGMDKIGHQEIVLEAVGHLRNFHYDLDRENLQHLALKLSTAATSLHRELSYCEDSSKLETRILSNVTNTISTIKPLACWLDRSPFTGQPEFTEKRSSLLKLAIDMATNGQRDRFADQPVAEISRMANQLAKLADEIIQDVSDPMLLQPASLDLATLKKRENDLGFSILPNYHGSLQISDIKFGSPAHTSGKIEDGDEIVQVNYQTVVGWQRQKVLLLFQESPPDVLLTLKKRPKHTKIYGQIYMKPYRLPSKKRALPFTRWHDNLPSPRPELLAIPDFDIPLSRRTKPVPEPVIDSSESSDTDSDIMTAQSPTVQNIMSETTRFYLPKPRSVLQRRNTISGSSPLCNRTNFDISQLWRELKQSTNHTGSSFDTHQLENDITLSDPLSLRDKSASCGYGLELSQRPKTCLGVSLNTKVNRCESKGKEDKQAFTNSTFKTEITCYVGDEGNLLDKESNDAIKNAAKTVRFDTLKASTDSVNIDGKILTIDDHIPFVDDESAEASNKSTDNTLNNSKRESNEKLQTEKDGTQVKFVYPQSHNQDDCSQTVNTVQSATIKSLSSSKEFRNPGTELKPVVEPRTVFLYAPEPPPRPLNTLKPVPPLRKSSSREGASSENTALKTVPEIDLPSTSSGPSTSTPQKIEADTPKHSRTNAKDSCDVSKIMDSPKTSGTPSMKSLLTKSRNIRKKNSLINKRRCVSPKSLLSTVPPPIKQGWLYQRVRTKNHQVPKWEKRFFILVDSILYGFYSHQAPKACCMLLLPGYTVSLASEVKSRELAFRVYHTGTVFYFSAESPEELSQWLQLLSKATLSSENQSDIENSKLYSESDTSDEEKDNSNVANDSFGDQASHSADAKGASKLATSTPNKTVKSEKGHNLKFGSLKKFARNKTEENASSSTSLDRKYLRFFSKSSEKSKHLDKNINKANLDVPVPTAQYRSYRKITQTITTTHVPISNITNANCDDKGGITHLVNESAEPRKQERKIPAPINYTHASNPNLIDFDASDFANKTHQFKSPSEKQPSRSDNLIGFVTLEQFMLNKQKEETAQVYSNRVLCGIEDARLKDIEENKMHKENCNKVKSDDLQKQLQRIVPDVIYGQLNQIDTKSLPRKLPNTQSKAVTKPPELPSPRTETFKSLPRKIYQSNLGEEYEIINSREDDIIKYVGQKNVLNESQPDSSKTSHRVKDREVAKHQVLMNNEISSNDQQKYGNKFKTINGNVHQGKVFEEKYEFNEKCKNEKMHSSHGLDKCNKPSTQLKPAAQYTPMNLPLNSKISNQTVDINLEKSDCEPESNFLKLKNIFQTSLESSCNNKKNRHNRTCDNKNSIGLNLTPK